MKSNFLSLIIVFVVANICLIPLPATAYVGPGVGLSALGSLLALIAAIIIAIFGFLWYPFKRLMRKKQRPVKADEPKK